MENKYSFIPNNLIFHIIMLLNDEILKITNLKFENGVFCFNSEIDTNIINNFMTNYKNNFVLNNYNYTYENVLVINNLHYCYSHMLIDNFFSVYWAIKDISKTLINPDSKIKIIIRTNTRCGEHDNKCLKNVSNNKFKKDAWNNMVSLITDDELIFEHNFNDTITIKNCYFYIIDDKWQRSIWNCKGVYPGRNTIIPKYTDKQIYGIMDMFINDIFKNNNIERPSTIKGKNAIIIERNDNRKWDCDKLNLVVNNLKKTDIQFNGIKILDHLTLKEQIKLFTSNNIFIFRHGSCLTNLLWIPQNSLIFDIDVKMNRNLITQRVADCTNSKVIRLNYIEFNSSDIINNLNN